MKNFRYLFLWIVLPMLSCEKQDNNSDNGKDPITDVYDNAYFPLDVNDQWIYSSTICLFDDVADSIDDNYCATSIDTIIPGPKKLMGNIVAVKFGAKYFNTQYNKVSLIIDTNTVFKQQYIIDILYTDKRDTSWTFTIHHVHYGNATIRFEQSKNHDDTAEKITLTISQGYLIGLWDCYVFQKHNGIIRSSFTGVNTDGYTELREYRDN